MRSTRSHVAEDEALSLHEATSSPAQPAPSALPAPAVQPQADVIFQLL